MCGHCRANRDAAAAVAERIVATGRRAHVVAAELSDAASVAAMRQEIVDALGPATVVVANAVSQVHPWQPVLDEDPEDYVDQFRSCVLRAMHLAQAFIPDMRAAGYGRSSASAPNTSCRTRRRCRPMSRASVA